MRSTWQVSRPSGVRSPDTRREYHNGSANMSARRVDDVLDEVVKQQREIHVGERVRTLVESYSSHSNGVNDHDRVADTLFEQRSAQGLPHNYAYPTRASVSLPTRREKNEAAPEAFAVGELSTESTWSMHATRRGGDGRVGWGEEEKEETYNFSASRIPFHPQPQRGNSASSLTSSFNSMQVNSIASGEERGKKKEAHEKRAPPQSSLPQPRPLEHPSQFASYLRTSAPLTATSSSVGNTNSSRQHGGGGSGYGGPRRFNPDANPTDTIKKSEANYKYSLPSNRSSIAKSESARSSTMSSTVVVSAPPSPPTQRTHFLSPSASPDPNNYADRGDRNARRIHVGADAGDGTHRSDFATSHNHYTTHYADTHEQNKSIAIDAEDGGLRRGRSTKPSLNEEVVGASVSRLIAESEARRSASAQALKQLHNTFYEDYYDSAIDRHVNEGEGGWVHSREAFGVGGSGPKSQHVVVYDTASPVRSNAAYLHFDPHYDHETSVQQQRSTNTPPRVSDKSGTGHAGKIMPGREERGLVTTTRRANVGAVMQNQAAAAVADVSVRAGASSVELNSVAASRHRHEVLETDNEIRRAYGVPRGSGASVIQADALIAALASAMVLLKKYENE